MVLKTKYKFLVDTATAMGIQNLIIEESNGLLVISGITQNIDDKNKLWDIYNQIDPNYISNEVDLNIVVEGEYNLLNGRVVTESTNLNVRKGPGIECPIIDKVAKNEIVTVLGRANYQWWLIRTKSKVEGYCYADYIQIMAE